MFRLILSCRAVGVVLLATVLLTPAACARPEAPAGRPAATAPSHPRSDEGLATVAGAAPAGAVVSLQPAGGPPPAPADPAVIDQRGNQFLPGFLMIQSGQTVEFRNSENLPHNVFVAQRRTGRTILDVSTDPGQQHTHTFDRPGEFEVSCNIHEGMEATIIVTASPLAAVADAQSRFAIRNVPPGGYTLVISDAGSPTESELAVMAPLTEVGPSSRLK
ncbi:MAG: hypothetical protein IT180_14245 [Acidobacteria bacterium]|nr:hypothetical protein [Acidobacteriota bacterium]